MASTLSYLDSYCERAGDAALFAEPLNAATNLLFILAAFAATYALARLPQGSRKKPIDLWLLVTALLAIGIGSGLWHLVPTHQTVLMDVIPITCFIHVYLLSAMRRLLHFSWMSTFLGWGAYTALTVIAQIGLPPDLWNGTVMYLPTYAALTLLTLGVLRMNRSQGNIFLSMLALWTVSLVLRTADPQVCSHLAIGTHFLWHVFNAWVLYRLLTLLIKTIRA